MDKVIRIDEYRRLHSRSAEAHREIWSCGVCGESAWTVTTSGRLHCRHCDTTAANLQVADEVLERDTTTDQDAHTRWNPLMAPGQWWWTWARQS